MSDKPKPPFQFSIRTMFVVVTLVAIVIGGVAQFGRMLREARKDAVRKAILNGNIPPESGRDELGDEVDQLAKTRKP